MMAKKKVSKAKKTIDKKVGPQGMKAIEQQIKVEVDKLAAVAATQSAWIHHYLLIDFGFSGDYFIPNSIQFYSSTGFLCSKLIDNTSLVSLVPILDCQHCSRRYWLGDRAGRCSSRHPRTWATSRLGINFRQ